MENEVAIILLNLYRDPGPYWAWRGKKGERGLGGSICRSEGKGKEGGSKEVPGKKKKENAALAFLFVPHHYG